MRRLISFFKKNIWTENHSLKSKFNAFLEVAIVILFGITFFSIPAFSFIGVGRFVTWALTVLLVLAIVIDLFLYRTLKIDILFLSFVLFSLSAFISSSLCLFKAFKLTPILLSMLAAIIYCFCYSTKGKFKAKVLFFSAYLGVLLFLSVFIYRYKSELIHLNFSRLGNLFGDENDVALFIGFGMVESLFYGLNFKRRTWFLNILNFVFFVLLLIVGLSTGSKIFIFICIMCLLAFPFLKFGKKRWWLSVLTILVLAGLFFALINLPFLSSVKIRFDSFISTLLGKNVSDGKTGELSTVNRLDMFVCGMQMWLRKPIFGWGIWGFATFSGRAGGWSHNNISESFCNFGLVGTILFHVGFFTSLIGYAKSKNKKNLMMPFILLLFFMVSMLSVALNSQKLYALPIGIIFSQLSNTKPLLNVNVIEKIRKIRIFRREPAINED